MDDMQGVEPSPNRTKVGRLSDPIVNRRKADEWRFVLRAVGIGSWVAPTDNGNFALMVRVEHLPRATQELSEYEQENRERLLKRPKRDVPLYRNSWWAVATVAAMAVFFSVTRPEPHAFSLLPGRGG